MSKLNTRVNETGAASYVQTVEASRRLREIKFTPQHCYIRGFLKYATTSTTRPGKDAEFITDTMPGNVFLGELLGEDVYNQLREVETSNGYRPNSNNSCIEETISIGKQIVEICKGVDPTSEESAFEKAIEESEFKLEWAKNYVKRVQESLILTRPEYTNKFGIKEFCGLATSNFDIIILPILQQMVKTFSVTRTDLITWVAKSQSVNFGDKFRVGSIINADEDDGEMLNTCYKLAALSEEISIHNFMQTSEGSVFPAPDMASKTFRDTYRKWATTFKSGRIPWSRPTDNPVHFCVDVECSLNKSSLILDPSTNQPAYSFGYYRSSLGEGGKMSKILGAAKTGTANDDPDFIQVFMGYTSSDDPQTASRNMNVTDITIPGKVIFSHKQIEDAFMTLAMDTHKRKVRLYDEFPLTDSIRNFREYCIDNDIVNKIDTSNHEEALAILGIDVAKTDAESIANGLYTAPNQPQASIASAAARAMAPQVPPTTPQVPPTTPQVPQTTPQVPQTTPQVPPQVPPTTPQVPPQGSTNDVPSPMIPPVQATGVEGVVLPNIPM